MFVSEVLSAARASARLRVFPGWLAEIRRLELDRISAFLPRGGRVLDFGAGPGDQALKLKELGFEVDAVDLQTSSPRASPVFPVRSYDGRILPFPDACFDAVMSSNVLEHVKDLPATLRELARVLKPGGTMVHVVPSSAWRWWSTLAEFGAAPRNAWLMRGMRCDRSGDRVPMARWRWSVGVLACFFAWVVRAFLFRPHGEGGSALTELWTFSRYAWSRQFVTQGCQVLHVEPMKLWYTGETLMGPRLSLARRARMSKWLGSVAVLYVIRPPSSKVAA